MTSKLPHRLLGTLAIAACVLAAYAGSMDGVFVFDDEIAIVKHESIGTLWPPSVPLTGPHESPSSGRPLVSLSLALNFAFGGLDPRGYHAFNMVVHLLVSLLLWRVAQRLLLRMPAMGRRARSLALASALIFAAHPLGTSVVTYISQRAESMMALFLLASLYCWIRQREDPPSRKWGVLAVLFCTLSMLCKEVGYATPLIAALLDRAFYSASWSELWRERKRLYVAMFSTWLVLLASLVFGARGATVSWVYREYDSWTYLLTSARAILHYLSLLFWPSPLVIDYGWPIARTFSEAWWQVALLTCGLLGSVGCLNRRPKLAFAGLSFFIVLAPSSSVIPIVTEIMAEHRMYLPSTLVISVVVLGVYRLGNRLPGSVGRMLALLAVVATLALSIRTTRIQNRLYTDALEMYAHNTLHSPDNYRAHYNLGYHLSAADRYPEALESFAAALRIDPSFAPAYQATAYVACYQGNTSAALRYIDRALELKPLDAYNMTAKGSFLAILNQPEAGMAWIEKALATEPGFSEALKWKVNVFLLAKRARAADRALAVYDPALTPEQRKRELQVRYRDLMQLVQANESP